MQSEHEKLAMQGNLTQLRLESFEIMLVLTGVVGWMWFSWAIWPQDSYGLFRSNAWMVSALLLVTTLLSYLLKRWFVLATAVFVGGLIAVVTGTIILFDAIEAVYLYIIPIVFASVLLGQFSVIATTVSTGVLALVVVMIEPHLDTPDLVIPFMTIVLTAVATLIAIHNLHTAFAWSLAGYQESHKNELLARENKSKLERALKSLDAAMANLKRTNLMLTQARNEAEDARKLKQQFAQTISHELRTPLNLIAGFTETMIKSPEYYGGSLSPMYLRDLSVVYRNACHLQNLVNDVLDLARLEAAYMALESERLNLVDVIEDAINTARGLVVGRGLALHTHIAPDLPPVWGDAVRLKQVILNLLNNAARFTEDGSVTVSADCQDKDVIVCVADTGIGIPTDSIPQIFESFRQLENPMQRRTEGAGLGLAISQQLIHLHGGHIWAESQVGVGSRFFFSLPTGPLETLDTSKSLEPGSAWVGVQDPVVLIVTRSPSAAALLSRHLPGYQTITVAELEQAHTAAHQVIPQAMIIDSATEALSADDLRSFTARLDLPQTVVITCPLPGEEPQRKRLAVDGYMIKPISREELWNVLRQFNESLNRVLVVDDDHDFVRLIGRMLTGPVRQYHVTYAYSGTEALEMIKHSRPEILLLDLKLPDIDGFQVIQAVRADPANDAMRIVIITAYEEVDSSNLLAGTLSVTRGTGMMPTQIIGWIQGMLDHTKPAPS